MMLESFLSLVCLPALHTDSLDQPACRLAAHHAGRNRLAWCAGALWLWEDVRAASGHFA